MAKKLFQLSVFLSKLKKICGQNLKAVIATGSVSEVNFIKGWSDIDLIVVVGKMEPKQLIAIGKIDNIGVSVVSQRDFSAKILSPKILYGLKHPNSQILFSEIKMPKVYLREISGDFRTTLIFYYDMLIKCATRGISPESAKKAIKLVFIMIKVIAREYGKNLKSYDDCIDFCKKANLNYRRYAESEKSRYKWGEIKNYEPVMVKTLILGEEMFGYGKNAFRKNSRNTSKSQANF